jgi:Ran GTPase-activating protein (RanGAP) involved in mRNA processing and transport
LDLSQNQLGVYGITLIAKSLQKNTTLKGLNLFKNTLDVDGARALRDLLKVNHSIEFLDVGHNRIRQKGLEAITEGILHTEQCKLKTLGLRMNFINDDGFSRFFEEVIFSGMSKIQNLYVS